MTFSDEECVSILRNRLLVDSSRCTHQQRRALLKVSTLVSPLIGTSMTTRLDAEVSAYLLEEALKDD